MALRDNIISFNSAERKPALDERARQATVECRHVVERILPVLMGGLFEKLDDALYELSDKSESDQLQSAYFNAMRTVRKQRGRIQDNFFRGVIRGYEQLWAQGPRDLTSESGSEDEFDLSLVDNEELEETLAVNNLISKGENRYHRELFALNGRFSVILGGRELGSQSNPLGPAAICNRFRESLEALAVELPVRLVIYKLFDRQVMHYLNGLYEEINTLLAQVGIVPKPAPHVPRRQTSGPASTLRSRSDAPSPPAQQPGYGPASDPGQIPAGPGGQYAGGGYPGGPVGPAEALQTEVFRTLQELLTGYRANVGMPIQHYHQPNLPVVDTRELIGALSSLQQASQSHLLHGEEPAESQADIRRRLVDELSLQQDGEDRRTLDKADGDALDVISMLFDILLEDPNLPDAIKALIARLQIPMLKVAIMDKTFFSRRLHPARRLLNNLARAAVGWSDDGDRSENSLYGRIESVVNRVISGFEEDPRLFEELEEEFAAYMEREQRGAEIAEERTNQVTRGKEQLRVAKKLVSDQIARRLAEHPRVPMVVRNLVEDGWKDVLLLTYLRQGPESDAWADAVEITDRLLWSVAPKTAYSQRQELLRTIPELLRALREGLNSISFDQHKLARMFKELQACHISSLRGAQTEGQNSDSDEPPALAAKPLGAVDDAGDELNLAEQGGDETIQHDAHTDCAESLQVGTWLQLEEDDGRRVRIKLSWKSDVSDAYVFVNRKGVKVLEMTMAGVARLFREGKVEVLQDVNVPIMDRALDAMMATLQKNTEDEG